MVRTHQWLELVEYKPSYFDRSELSDLLIEELCDRYERHVKVELPTSKTNGKWKLRSLGWVGYIPLSTSIGLHIKPKVPIFNLFQMLEYAYHLESMKYIDGLISCNSIQELYERLANLLALKILNRCKIGLYKTYEEEHDQLPYVRGRLNTQQLFKRPYDIQLPCEYQEQTFDNEDNQILTWTLYRIIQSGFCTYEKSLANVQSAFKKLKSYTTLKPFRSQDCIGRAYHRLNRDYELLHALCRVFLELLALTHERGEYKAVPFLVNMARLYEVFVAEWLKKHMPSGYRVKAQERMKIGEYIRFNIDLVIYDMESNKARCVLDTKYKISTKPNNDDINQIVAYATSKGCKEAILVYPLDDIKHIDEYIGDVRVRTLSFSIDKDIQLCGKAFLEKLFSAK